MDPQNFKTPDISQIKPSQNQTKSFIAFLGLAIAGILVWNMWFTVEPEEVGLVLRFGKYVRQAEPGLNFKMPEPVEQVIKVPVQRQHKEEFGFRTETPGIRSRFSTRQYSQEALMLTGDLNVAMVEWIAQYRIRDPYLFLFRVRNPIKTFRDMNEAVVREVVGNRTVNDILTIGRESVASEVKAKLQQMCKRYETGIEVEQVVLQDINPPDQVKPSFNEVNQAQQEKEKMINDAMASYNKIIPRAKGEALRTIQAAEGYASDRINRAKGDVAFFEEILREYKKAPEVTRQRLYLEAMEEIYPSVKKKTIIDSEIKGLLPMLNLQKGAR